MATGTTTVDGPAATEQDARLARLEACYESLEAALGDLEDLARGNGAPGGSQGPQTPPEPDYPDVQTWVGEWFAPIFGRRLGAVHWCTVWWQHDEAVFRLEALWRSWETLRLDGGMGMATWIRDHLDNARRELMGPDGPFQACDGADRSHNPPPPLPVTPTPAGWPGTA